VKYIIIIPSLNPDEALLEVVCSLKKAGYIDIIVVNDGSREELSYIFETAVREYGVTLLTHEMNKGKGWALKTAFGYILGNDIACDGVITVDSDGQHKAKDILLCQELAQQNKSAVVLGCRDFSNKEVPFKSKYGNSLTSAVFYKIGMPISDTQTGLRVIPYDLLKEFMQIDGERFEYETNMLIYLFKKKIPILEQKISTVYFEQNSKTSFRPFIDSLKIYSRLIKFFVVSGLSFIVDYGLYLLFLALFSEQFKESAAVFYSVSVARILSSIFNYLMNRRAVFKSENLAHNSFFRYVFLVVMQMLTSAGLVILFSKFLAFDPKYIKIPIDIVLAFVSYNVQKKYVFKKIKS